MKTKTLNQAKNTDTELWRDKLGNSLFVTRDGDVGMNVHGRCVVKSMQAWLDLAWPRLPLEPKE